MSLRLLVLFLCLSSVVFGDPSKDIAPQTRDFPTSVRSWTLTSGKSVYGRVTAWNETDGKITFDEKVSDFEADSKSNKVAKTYRQSDFSERNQEYLERYLTGVVKGRVISIADGDTLTLLTNANDQIKIRLHGVDAPESGQAYSNKAKGHLSSLVGGKKITVHLRKGKIWEREVGTVYDENGQNVNLEMVEAGFAWHATKFLPGNEVYAKTQEDARSTHRGLWADDHSIAPWELRERKKNFKANDQLAAESKKVRVVEPRFAQLREKVVSGDGAESSFEHRTGLTKKLTPEIWKPVGPKFWLTDTSKKRHNEFCTHFQKTNGRFSTANEGTACKQCGG